MFNRMRSLYVALLAAMASATPNIYPHATMEMANAFALDGYSPSPTEGPSMEVLADRLGHLERRQAAGLSSGQLVGYFAQDSMCGYISGSIGASLPCGPASRCAAVAPIGGQPGALGCCQTSGGSGCYFITTCYNQAEVQSSKCDAGCQQDQNVRLCTAASSSFCFGYSWPEISATFWGCAASSVSTKVPVTLNFLGESPTKTWSAYYYTPSASSSNGLIGAVTSSLASASSANAQSSSPSPTPPAKSSTNVGAIVGGVVGGLAVLGAIAFGIVFLLLRKRKNRKATDANAAAAAQNIGGYPQGQPGQPGQPGYGAPAGGAAAGYYGQEAKQPVSELGSPVPSPGAGYLQPAGGAPVDPNAQYHDHRVSAYSETGSPVPPYPQQQYQNQMQPIQQNAPMELDGTPSQYLGPHGQPVYEAPAGVPGNKP